MRAEGQEDGKGLKSEGKSEAGRSLAMVRKPTAVEKAE